MQPHQIAAEKIRESGEYPYHVLKNLGLTAVGGAAAKLGTAAASKLIPHINALISEHVPEKFAEKALSKLDPRIGEFVNKAKEGGYDFNEIKQFIGDKINKPSEATEEKNIIQKVSPELHQFISNEVSAGRTPLEAGAIAAQEQKGGKGFKSIIDKLVKQHKTSWAAILETVYGSGQYGGAVNPKQSQTQQGQQQSQQQGNKQMPFKVGDKFIDRRGREAVFTHLDDKTFEYKTENGTRSGPISSLEYEIQQDQQPQQGQQQQGIDPQLAQILQQGNQLMQRFRGK